MSDEKTKIFLIDGMALIYRWHFALMRNPRITSNGFNTSAIFGYLTTINEIITKYSPTHLAVAFDTPEPTFRHEVFPEYKANRDAMPEDLSLAIPHIFKVTEALNIPILKLPGYEADDIIGTLARMATEEGKITFMVTPDKDFGQLVSESVFQYRPGREGVEIYGIPEILEKWGIERIDQVIDVLGMAGDSADNIPGIPGVGPKTAQKLIAQYGTLENIIEHTDELKGKQKERFQEFKDQAILSKQLVTIDTHVPIEITLDDLIRKEIHVEQLTELCQAYEFNQLGKRLLGKEYVAAPAGKKTRLDLPGFEEVESEIAEDLATIKTVKHDYVMIKEADTDQLIATLSELDEFCFDLETSSINPHNTQIVGIAFSWAAHSACYVPFPNEPLFEMMELGKYKELFENPAIKKVGHNLKFDITVLKTKEINVQGELFDTMLAQFLLAPDKSQKMDYMAQFYLQYDPVPISTLIGEDKKNQISMLQVPQTKITDYACEDADITWQLKNYLAPLLSENNAETIFEFENELISVLIDMETEGIRLDPDPLKVFSTELIGEMHALQDDIYDDAGTDFELNSPKQVGQILFDKMKLEEKPKKTKTGQYKTDEQTLMQLSAKHKIVRKILDYRHIQKLQSTYLNALPEAINQSTGRVHTTYNQAVAATGRIQSQNPNMQNIPIRTERGREIRKAFIPRNDDYTILSADYSQIELRIIAEISKDPTLLDLFNQGVDIHKATASKVFHVALDDVDDSMRSKSKMVNYGVAYGMSAFGLSQRLNISRKEAKAFIDGYFIAFPGIATYMEQIVDYAREHGFVETLLGRRRYLRDINSRNWSSRAAAERNAINSPIQGSAADMIKVAMNSVAKEFAKNNFKTKMLLQVHDELVFDLYKDEKDEIIPIIEDCMCNAMKMTVPITVDIGMGANWLEAH